MKLEKLIEFVKPLSLAEDQKKEERVIESKSQTSSMNDAAGTGYMILTTVNDIEEKILPEWKATVLYVAQKDDMTHMDMMEDLAREYGFFMNIALLVVDPESSSADLKGEFKNTKLHNSAFIQT